MANANIMLCTQGHQKWGEGTHLPTPLPPNRLAGPPQTNKQKKKQINQTMFFINLHVTEANFAAHVERDNDIYLTKIVVLDQTKSFLSYGSVIFLVMFSFETVP